MRWPGGWQCALAVLLAIVGMQRVGAQPEDLGRVGRLPQRPPPHGFWLSDVLLHRVAFFDAKRQTMLGTITSGSANVGFVIHPVFSRERGEIYLPETYYSRGVRGERSDLVTVYDAATLEPLAEIPIPPHRGEYFAGAAANALSDDGRFLAVFNVTPATSLSIVDTIARRFVTEVETPGCSLVYGAGVRRFFMLCANGQALVVTLDATGMPETITRTTAFFDPATDPVMEKAVRADDRWYFVSFEGRIHEVDVSGAELQFTRPWALLDAADAGWRVGGQQPLAVHARSRGLYVLMHQGGIDTHKAAGTQVWVYDLANRRRSLRFPLDNPLVAFLGQQAGLARDGWTRALLRLVLPNPGVSAILVTQDDEPVLIAAAQEPPNLSVHDARTGALVGEIRDAGLALGLLFAP